MARKKRKFIDKKNAVTFRLVHRSQKDPLTADENAPKRVLQPIDKAREDEKEKYGIFYDDDYDYMQHLKETTSGTDLVRVDDVKQPRVELAKVVSKGDKTVLLPSSVFPSEVESKVGLLNKAAPRSGLQLDLDPDIVAAMDEDFDYDDPDNQLDDDFIIQANGGLLQIDEGDSDMDGEYEDYDEEDDDDDSVDSDERMDELMDLEETKSRFTEYSMTSSVIRRNEQLSLLDDKFEKMFAEYDDNEVGALDCEEIEGELDTESEFLKRMTEEFEKAQIVEKWDLKRTTVPDESETSDDSDCSLIEVKPKEEWDCESILSTYSNIYNHPKLITNPGSNRIKVNARTGVPVSDNKLTKSTLSKLEGAEDGRSGPGSIASIVSALSVRPKGETPEERANRKKAYKEFKKERRMERKCNKEAFKEEKKKMEKVMQNTNKVKHHIPI
uniref:Protein LTV1 homolog n=1 Tax=Lygus hesperus TaxID=30085 RepID=A0A0A9XMK6_LYGHE